MQGKHNVRKGYFIRKTPYPGMWNSSHILGHIWTMGLLCGHQLNQQRLRRWNSGRASGSRTSSLRTSEAVLAQLLLTLLPPKAMPIKASWLCPSYPVAGWAGRSRFIDQICLRSQMFDTPALPQPSFFLLFITCIGGSNRQKSPVPLSCRPPS